MQKPICNNCKYKSKLLSVEMCSRPLGIISAVTGKEDTEYVSCSVERLFETYLDKPRCGPSGKFFVQNTSGWFKLKQKIKNLVG